MTRNLWSAGLLSLLSLLPACSRVRVDTQFDPEANFSSYGSFAFLPEGGMKKHSAPLPRRLRAMKDPLFHAHIQEAVDETLSDKGFLRFRERKNADLLIGYRTVIKDQVDTVPPIYGVGWRGHVHMVRPGHVRWYKEGTLVVDVIDRRTKHLIWRGVGVGAMRDMRPGDDLRAAVKEILESFPPE